MALPPAPINVTDNSSFVWLEWYRKLRDYLNTSGNVPWAVVNKAGSNLNELTTRAHSSLQSLQGGTVGEYNHLTNTELATIQTLTSGTYTPTLTNTTNISASTAYTCQYVRVGSVVTVSGRVDIDVTAVGLIQMGMSLPIASNFTASNQAGGSGSPITIGDRSCAIYADSTNDRVVFEKSANDTTNQATYFTFTYLIL